MCNLPASPSCVRPLSNLRMVRYAEEQFYRRHHDQNTAIWAPQVRDLPISHHASPHISPCISSPSMAFADLHAHPCASIRAHACSPSSCT